MENIKAVIEALILASETPLVLEKICIILSGVEKSEIKEALEKLVLEFTCRKLPAVFNSEPGLNLAPGLKSSRVQNLILYLRQRWKLWQLLLISSPLLNLKLKVFAGWM
jgi:hypothetical protein